jgi:SOS-response transcriptional repressor LexA
MDIGTLRVYEPYGRSTAMIESELTARQAETLRVIKECIREKGYPPTMREIGDRMNIASKNGVLGHLRTLEEKGWIVRGASKASRAIRVIDKPVQPKRSGDTATSGVCYVGA